MKATLDIPDDLYRRVKARSAMEGRPLRAVAIELFQSWLSTGDTEQARPATSLPSEQDLAEFPWLAITKKYVNPGASHDMEDIRRSISNGWAEETVSAKQVKS